MGTTRAAAGGVGAGAVRGGRAGEGAAPAVPRPWKASMMPMTVPKSPMNGAMAAMVASQVMRLSIAVRASLAAVWAARSSAVGLRGMPRPLFCRWYSSWISLKTATRGLGLNGAATAAISLSRVDLRKARRKRRLWVWALPKRDHLEIMMAQEKMLARRRITRTAK